MDKALIDSVHPLTAGHASRMPKPPKPNKNVTFVTGLYHTYFRRGADPAELSYALEQLANGVSQSALRNDFKIVVSKTGNRVSAPRYVNALFATIGGRPPTPVSQAYWLGLANSGLSRQQLRQRFQSSNGTLPQPTLTWTNPANYLEPGEILFLPIGCLHFVQALEISVTMSVTNFQFDDNDFTSFYERHRSV